MENVDSYYRTGKYKYECVKKHREERERLSFNFIHAKIGTYVELGYLYLKYNKPPYNNNNNNTIFKVQKIQERKTKDKQQNSRQLFVF